MDDVSGLIWIVFEDRQYSDYLKVVTLDTETGKTGFTKDFGKYQLSGTSPVITSEGDQVFFVSSGAESITPYGVVGWNFDLNAEVFSNVMNSRDVLTVMTDDDTISSIKYGSTGDKLWTLNLTDAKTSTLGPITRTDDGYLYFCKTKAPFKVWIVEESSGSIYESQTFPYIGNDNQFTNKLAIDKNQRKIYFVDNWSDYFNNGPYLYALADKFLERMWNVSLQGTGARRGRTVCGNPMVSPNGKVSVLCTIKGRKLFRSLYVSDSYGNLNFIDFDYMDGNCIDPVLLNDTTVIVQCDYQAYESRIYAFDIENFTPAVEYPLESVRDTFTFSPIADSSSCLYYGYKTGSSNILNKKCF